MLKYIFSFALFAFFFACKNTDQPSISKGHITIGVDEAIKPILDAQVSTYKIHYPDADISTIVMQEDKGINELFKDSISLMACTREFNADERAVMKSRGIKYNPARFAVDAVALVVSENSKIDKLSIKELKALFNKPGSKLIFDNGNSANLNLIADKIGLDSIPKSTVFAAKGNLEVLESVKKSPGAIGFIGFNWISDKDDPQSAKRMKGLKLVAVEKPNTGAYFEPNTKNIKDRNYAFERYIYLHTLSKVWGIENGFIRHSCSKIGQLVTEKMGLVPFYIIPKEFLLNNKAKQYNPVK